MSMRAQLFDRIKQKKSFLCIGLDPDLDRFPEHLKHDPDAIFLFNKAIIDATHDLCVAYKPNLAFYEALGLTGMEAFAKTLVYIPDDLFVIADAKRGDIGNTSRQYAKAFFGHYDCDALTIAPYMGIDSVQPFLADHPNKVVVLLALTSNTGSSDFQLTAQENGQPLYAKVIQRAQKWATPDQLMFVCGATHPDKFKELRKLAPEHFFLVPGIGAQGGDLKGVSRFGMNAQCGLLVNSSRSILYAGKDENFAQAARASAQELQREMEGALAMYLP